MTDSGLKSKDQNKSKFQAANLDVGIPKYQSIRASEHQNIRGSEYQSENIRLSDEQASWF